MSVSFLKVAGGEGSHKGTTGGSQNKKDVGSFLTCSRLFQ